MSTVGKRKYHKPGDTFGQWTLLAFAGRGAWHMRCSCGAERTQSPSNLVRGASNACGQCSPRLHRMSGTRPYRIWTNAKRRPYTTMAPVWAASFQAFWRDMAEGYADHLTLDRVDGAKGYEPGNCRWVTQKVQAANRKCTEYVDTPAGRMTYYDAATAYGLSPATIRTRALAGLTGSELVRAAEAWRKSTRKPGIPPTWKAPSEVAAALSLPG